MNKFKKYAFSSYMQEADIEFHDTSGGLVTQSPIKLAKDVEPFFKKYQMEKYGEFTFAGCPGMLDFARCGYILPAWTQIHIKANLAGDKIIARKTVKPSEDTYEESKVFDFHPSIDDGVFNRENTVSNHIYAHNLPSPWSVRTKPNISLLLLPALYHNKHLDNLYVHSGIVDYSNGFHSLNFVFAIKKKCEFKIEIGEPLLQLVPITNELVSAEYGQTTAFKNSAAKWYPAQVIQNFYRKFFWKKKKYTLKNRNNIYTDNR